MRTLLAEPGGYCAESGVNARAEYVRARSGCLVKKVFVATYIFGGIYSP